MSTAPSWLTEENISTASKVASNPAAQSAGKAAAKSYVASADWSDDAPAEKDLESGKKDPKKDAKKDKKADKKAESPRKVPPPPSAKAPINTDMTDIDPDVLKQMQRWHLALRVLYICSSVFLAVAAGLSLTGQSDLGLIFMAIYVLFFSAMICCFEFALNAVAKIIAVNFGFMYTLTGRTVFILMVGFMSFSISLIGKIAMAVLFAVCAVQIFLMWKFPRFEEYLRKKHYFEGRQAENIAKQVARTAAK